MLFPAFIFAQNSRPSIPPAGASPQSFVPKNWKIIYQAKGDLNKDKLADQALIIESTDPKNIIKNDGFGTKELNLNPRILLVLFKTENGYQLKAKNQRFIPTEGDTVSTCLTDPLYETGAISIKNGTLVLSYHYWLSCGSYGVTSVDYTFRFQHEKLELIGFDSHSFMRNTGEENRMSVNFSTLRSSYTDGGNVFSDQTNKPKTTWKKFVWPRLFTLDEMTNEKADKVQDIN